MTFGVLIDYARIGFGAAAISAGLLLMLASAVGVLRFPDFFSRLHAAGPSMSLGVVLVLMGLVARAPSAEIAVRLGVLILLTAALTPVLPYALARGAQAAGVTPLVGVSTPLRDKGGPR
jgi:multicomponent Na+:H+ antiporter subunit G